ncbi:MAG TPA: PDZ domain-containing protein [Candidatus Acidoferrales bacterium]|jgi:predicted metalloprotease with PDZ domain|nr:PDZ domain-containing protein [Candidatus Acidoferrales bacterium]
MKLRLRAWPVAAILVALFYFASPARATIDYTVSLAHPDRHVFGVTMRIPNVRDHVTLQMPAWNALYQIRDFSSHMMQAAAKNDEGHPLPLTKLDKQTWNVAANGTVVVTYGIFWDETGPFATQLNSEHAFINFAMMLLYVPERRPEDTRVTFEDVPEGWRVAVELDSAGNKSGHHAGTYVAPNYDALVDAPVEIGLFDEFRMEAGGRPIRIVVHGDSGEKPKLVDALKRIVDYDVHLMGGAPFREYLFLFHVGSNYGGGGMEHMNCTAISADIPTQLPSYSAHEFFHAWNVKRIRPQGLEPVDYTKEMYTRSLWFAEGVTNTYGSYALERTGLWSPQQFYANLADQVRELQSRPAHRWQSVEQSSLDSWFEKYPLYNRPEESISYYNKGQIVGVLLDIIIRDRTDNRAGMDDVFRALNDEYAKAGKFYQESDALRAVMEEVIRKKDPGAIASLADFFERYIAGTDEIPYADYLGLAGLALRDSGQRRAGFGFTVTRDAASSPTVASVDPSSGASDAGLKDGDALVQLNGETFPRLSERWLRDHQPDERVTLKIQRGGEAMDISFPLGHLTDSTYQITEIASPTERQRRIRNGILRGITTP